MSNNELQAVVGHNEGIHSLLVFIVVVAALWTIYMIWKLSTDNKRSCCDHLSDVWDCVEETTDKITDKFSKKDK